MALATSRCFASTMSSTACFSASVAFGEPAFATASLYAWLALRVARSNARPLLKMETEPAREAAAWAVLCQPGDTPCFSADSCVMYCIAKNLLARALAKSAANPKSPPVFSSSAASSLRTARFPFTRSASDGSRIGDSEAFPSAFLPGAGTSELFLFQRFLPVSARFPIMTYFSWSLSARPDTMLPILSPAAFTAPGIENATSSARNWSVLCGIVAFHTLARYERCSSPSRPVRPRRKPPARSSSISSTTPSYPWATRVCMNLESRNAASVKFFAFPPATASQRAILPTVRSTASLPAPDDAAAEAILEAIDRPADFAPAPSTPPR